MRTSIIWGHVASNLGDLAINRGVVAMFNKTEPHAKYHVALLNPSETHFEKSIASFGLSPLPTYTSLTTRPRSLKARRGGIPEIDLLVEHSRDLSGFLDETGLSEADTIIFSPGEHLHTVHDEVRVDFLWRALPLIAARATGKRMIIPPVTTGPFADRRQRKFVRHLLSLPDEIALREPRSQSYFGDITNRRMAAVLPDVAFFVPMPESKPARTAQRLAMVVRMDNYGIRVGGPQSSATLRAARVNSFQDSKAFQHALAAATAYLAQDATAEVQLIVQVAADRELAHAVAGELTARGHGDSTSIAEPESVDDFIRMLGEANHLFATRFHACILAYVAGTPALGAFYHEHGHKMPGLFELLGAPERCIDLTSSSDDDIGVAMRQFVNDSETTDTQIATRLDELRGQATAWLETAVNQPAAAPDPSLVAEVLVHFRKAAARARKRAERELRSAN